jgi:uncharacterized protein (TIGR03083 family)
MSRIAPQYEPVPDLDVLRVDVDAAVAEGRAALGRMLGWLDGADPAQPIPGLEWTVRDVVAHLTNDSYARMARGEKSAFSLAQRVEQGAAARAALDPLPMPELVAQMKAHSEDFLDAITGRSSTEPLDWHSGEPMTVGLMASTVLNEVVLHGCDIAKAVGAAPVIPRRAAELGCPSMLATAVYVYQPPAKPTDARIEIRLRTVGALVWHFTNESLRLEAPDRAAKVDMHISADPVAFLKAGYGRMTQTRALLTGKLFAWGRRPGVMKLLQAFEPA